MILKLKIYIFGNNLWIFIKNSLLASLLFYFALPMIKLVEPVIERQISNIFADKNYLKINERSYKFAEEFTPEKGAL